MIRPILTAAGLAVLAATCTPPDDDAPETPADTTSTAADVEAIDQISELEVTAFTGGDADGLVALLTEDAVVMPPDAPTVSGRTQIRNWLQTLSEQVDMSGAYIDREVTVVGDRAIERYTADLAASPKDGPEAEPERMKGIHVYERQPDGSWLIALDIWNRDAPAGGSGGQ